MIKRTSLFYINSILKQNQNWNVLDIGCGYSPHPAASTICDVQDLKKNYLGKKFVQLKEKKFPFKDKEFDFVIASHVIEHVEDFESFIKELERISSQGYIELPSRLADNLVFENKEDHIWWFNYDDENRKIIASKRNQLVEPFMTVSTAKVFEDIFRESFILEVEWKEKIDYKIDNQIRYENFKKISFLTLLRKYISKKIRTFLR